MSKQARLATHLPPLYALGTTWRPLVQACVATLSLVAWNGARADNLVELFNTAKSYDAAYLAAKSQTQSVQYQVEQSFALQRPSVNLQAKIDRSHLNASEPVSPLITMLYGQTSNDVSATNKRIAVALKQSLYNEADSAKIDQAKLSLDASEADLNMAEQDLIVRLTQAYFDVLSAQDVLATAEANKKALSELLASAKRNFEVGNATITDTREAQARHDLAGAQSIAAANDLKVKRMALDQLVGRESVKPNPLQSPVKLEYLAPGQMDEWVDRGNTSPTVRKAEIGLNVATMETTKAKAGHMPTLDATASLARTGVVSSTASARTSAGTSGTIGLELNMPLFAGFAIQNRVKEALSLQDKAERTLDNAKRGVTLGTRQAFSGVQSGLAQVKALETAEGSAKLALEATQTGYKVGVRVNKDVLDAQNQLVSTQKDLYKARYDVIVGTVKLRQASGTLTGNDLAELNKLVVSPRP